MRNPEETIGKMIDKANTSFISYIDSDGYPITKAMLKPIERNGIKEIWFSTNTSSNKVKFFKERIWQEGDILYYKEGVTDPDYCVLKFTTIHGRYYSNFKSEDFEV